VNDVVGGERGSGGGGEEKVGRLLIRKRNLRTIDARGGRKIRKTNGGWANTDCVLQSGRVAFHRKSGNPGLGGF